MDIVISIGGVLVGIVTLSVTPLRLADEHPREAVSSGNVATLIVPGDAVVSRGYAAVLGN